MTIWDVVFLCALLTAVAGVTVLCAAFLGAIAVVGVLLLASSGALFLALGKTREDSET